MRRRADQAMEMGGALTWTYKGVHQLCAGTSRPSQPSLLQPLSHGVRRVSKPRPSHKSWHHPTMRAVRRLRSPTPAQT